MCPEPDRKGGTHEYGNLKQRTEIRRVALPSGRASDTYRCLRMNVAIFQASIAFQGISAVV